LAVTEALGKPGHLAGSENRHRRDLLGEGRIDELLRAIGNHNGSMDARSALNRFVIGQEVGDIAELVVEVRVVLVAETVIDRKPLSDLVIVLRVSGIFFRVAGGISVGDRTDRDGVGISQQEFRKGLPIFGGGAVRAEDVAGGIVERVNARLVVGVHIVVKRVNFAEIEAEFIGVLSVGVGQVVQDLERTGLRNRRCCAAGALKPVMETVGAESPGESGPGRFVKPSSDTMVAPSNESCWP